MFGVVLKGYSYKTDLDVWVVLEGYSYKTDLDVWGCFGRVLL